MRQTVHPPTQNTTHHCAIRALMHLWPCWHRMCAIAEGMGCLHKLAQAAERHHTWSAWRHRLDGTVRSEVTNVAKIVPTKKSRRALREVSKKLVISTSLVLERGPQQSAARRDCCRSYSWSQSGSLGPAVSALLICRYTFSSRSAQALIDSCLFRLSRKKYSSK